MSEFYRLLLINRNYRPVFSVFFRMSNIRDLKEFFFPKHDYVYVHLFIVWHSGHHFETKLDFWLHVFLAAATSGCIMNALTRYKIKV